MIPGSEPTAPAPQMGWVPWPQGPPPQMGWGDDDDDNDDDDEDDEDDEDDDDDDDGRPREALRGPPEAPKRLTRRSRRE